MANRLVIDTDVIIDYLRSQAQAVAWLEGATEQLSISVISVAELYSGVREGSERAVLDTFLLAFDIIPIDERIASQGGLYRRDYGKSHGVGLADALIAASVELRNAVLVTLNEKHFPMLEDVLVPYKKL